jgi:AAA15 family ATPase/GTPase
MAMINKLTLHNFKSIGEQTYEFTQFDLLVGSNNSGKYSPPGFGYLAVLH